MINVSAVNPIQFQEQTKKKNRKEKKTVSHKETVEREEQETNNYL